MALRISVDQGVLHPPLQEYEAGEAEREAQRAQVQASIAVERQRLKLEKERTRAIDDFKDERQRAWTDYEKQLEGMTGKSPVVCKYACIATLVRRGWRGIGVQGRGDREEGGGGAPAGLGAHQLQVFVLA